jgi:hypothetical protein
MMGSSKGNIIFEQNTHFDMISHEIGRLILKGTLTRVGMETETPVRP